MYVRKKTEVITNLFLSMGRICFTLKYRNTKDWSAYVIKRLLNNQC